MVVDEVLKFHLFIPNRCWVYHGKVVFCAVRAGVLCLSDSHSMAKNGKKAMVVMVTISKFMDEWIHGCKLYKMYLRCRSTVMRDENERMTDDVMWHNDTSGVSLAKWSVGDIPGSKALHIPCLSERVIV